jgi:hypothetical protein
MIKCFIDLKELIHSVDLSVIRTDFCHVCLNKCPQTLSSQTRTSPYHFITLGQQVQAIQNEGIC